MHRFLLVLAVLPLAYASFSTGMGMPALRLRGGSDGAPPAMPGMPPGMDMNAFNSMFQNPAFQEMASNLMQNPEFKSRMDDMMKNETLMKEYAKIGEQVLGGMGGGKANLGGAGFGDTASDTPGFTAGGMAGSGTPGMPPMPPGFDPSKLGAGAAGAAGGAGWEEMQQQAQAMMKNYLKPEQLEELAKSDEVKKIQEDPKMQAIIKDVQENGPMAVLKYYSDPDAMKIFSKITNMLGLPEEFQKAGQQFANLGMPGMPGMPGAPGAPGGAADGEAAAPKGNANALD